MKLVELYQEEPGGTFTNDGKDYDLNKVLADVDDLPKVLFFVKDLEWVLKYDTPDPGRVGEANTSAPILVAYYEGDKFVVVDGLHRLAKAIEKKIRFLIGRLVPADILEKDEVLSERFRSRKHGLPKS